VRAILNAQQFFKKFMALLLSILISRTVSPLLIIRWPLAGSIFALFIQALSGYLSLTYLSSIQGFSYTSELLTLYLLTIQAGTSLFWQNSLGTKIAIGLYAHRLIGILLFEFTGARYFLYIFPNLFEAYYLFHIGYTKLYKSEPQLSMPNFFKPSV
jgi:hypothetical protein